MNEWQKKIYSKVQIISIIVVIVSAGLLALLVVAANQPGFNLGVFLSIAHIFTLCVFYLIISTIAVLILCRKFIKFNTVVLLVVALFFAYFRMSHFCSYQYDELITSDNVEAAIEYFVEQNCAQYKKKAGGINCPITLDTIKQEASHCFKKDYINSMGCNGNITYFDEYDKAIVKRNTKVIYFIQLNTDIDKSLLGFIKSRVYFKAFNRLSTITNNSLDYYYFNVPCEINNK